MNKDYEMDTNLMTEQFDMFTGCYLTKLAQLSGASLVSINYGHGETDGKFSYMTLAT